MFDKTATSQIENYSGDDYQYSSYAKPILIAKIFDLKRSILKRKKILVVNTNHFDQISIQFVLERIGYDSEIASTGKSALSMYQDGYSLILIDINLPDIKGVIVTERIRQEEKVINRRNHSKSIWVEYAPSVIIPHHFSLSDPLERPVYFSLHYPNTLEIPLKSREDSSKLSDLVKMR